MAGEDDPTLPTPDEILTIHDRLEEVYDLKHTGTMTAAPRVALEKNVLAEAPKYDDPYHRAAALLRHLISTHVFDDANKRTAWTVAMEYLDEQVETHTDNQSVVCGY